MSYQDVFGGQTIYPANLTLLNLSIDSDVELSWPIAAQPDALVVADIIPVTAVNPNLSITMPDARMGSQGVAVLFHNLGAETFAILDNDGNQIVTVASGEAWEVYLSDNSTAAGAWETFQFGAGSSSANASALAGYGLKAILTTLNVKVAPTATMSSPIQPDETARASIIRWTGGVGVLTLPDPAVVGSDYFFYFRNSGTGSVTATPTSGLVNGAPTLIFKSGDSAMLVSDGINFYTVGFGQSLASFFDFISINVAGTGDYTLSAGELNKIAYRFTGILTGNRTIIIPNELQQYWVDNQTSGNFTLTVKTAGGTGVIVQQGEARILYCDSLDVIDATRILFPLGVPRGGTGLSTIAQGDTLYGSDTDEFSVLSKDTNATRYLANTGVDNNPNWDQVNLGNGVTGRLTAFTELPEGSALSVLGVPGNSVADLESIVASNNNQVLRRSGTSIGFGPINLAATQAAVTGTLAPGHGGTGLDTYAQGDILYAQNATTLARLAKVTPSIASLVSLLSNTGSNNNPAWITPRFGHTGSGAIDANMTFALSQGWTALYHSSGTHTWTIPPNSGVAFEIGTVLFLANAGGSLTIAPDTGVVLLGRGGTGSMAIGPNTSGFLVKLDTDLWFLFTEPSATAGNAGTSWIGRVDASGNWIIQPGSWSVGVVGATTTVTHNLGHSNYVVMLGEETTTDARVDSLGVTAFSVTGDVATAFMFNLIELA